MYYKTVDDASLSITVVKPTHVHAGDSAAAAAAAVRLER